MPLDELLDRDRRSIAEPGERRRQLGVVATRLVPCAPVPGRGFTISG